MLENEYGLGDDACRALVEHFQRQEGVSEIPGPGGLRCLYHGWKMDAEGNVLEMPSERPEACAAAKIKHRAYPTAEAGGFVWAWMGERDTMPARNPS